MHANPARATTAAQRAWCGYAAVGATKGGPALCRRGWRGRRTTGQDSYCCPRSKCGLFAKSVALITRNGGWRGRRTAGQDSVVAGPEADVQQPLRSRTVGLTSALPESLPTSRLEQRRRPARPQARMRQAHMHRRAANERPRHSSLPPTARGAGSSFCLHGSDRNRDASQKGCHSSQYPIGRFGTERRAESERSGEEKAAESQPIS